MKRLIPILCLAAGVAGLATFLTTGCANISTDPGVIAYNTEKTISDGAVAATHTFNLLYPTNSSPSIAATRQSLYTVDTNLFLTISVVNTLRTNYVATGETNASLGAALTSALATVQGQYSVITNLVNSVK